MQGVNIIKMVAGNVGYSVEGKTHKKVFFSNVLFCGIFIGVLMFSGCLDGLTQLPTTYEAHPTMISYVLEYGYEVSCSGSGRYDISYRCDYPEVLSGTVLPILLYKPKSQTTVTVDNQMIWWNLSGVNETTYRLGFRAEVTANSEVISHLTGEKAQLIEKDQDDS